MAGITFTKDNILTSDTTLVAVWKQSQFDITLKDTFQTDSTIIGASNGKFSLPVRSHNDFTFIGWKNMDGKTFHSQRHPHQRHHAGGCLEAAAIQHNADQCRKDTSKMRVSNGKYTLQRQPNTITPYWDG